LEAVVDLVSYCENLSLASLDRTTSTMIDHLAAALPNKGLWEAQAVLPISKSTHNGSDYCEASRRVTRLANGFSKKWSNHEAMMNVVFAVYNSCKVHGTIKTTPAVAAGITDHVWTVRELIEKTSGAH